MSKGNGLIGWLRSEKAADSAADVGLPAKVPFVDLHERFEDRGEIQRAAYGSVRRVVDRNIGRLVAMKVLDPALQKEAAHVTRFLEEAQITGSLNHPNIPPVHELCCDVDGTLYFTMQHVSGTGLSDLLTDDDYGFEPDAALDRRLEIITRLCDPLAYAHSRGVIHRALQPDAVTIGAFGEVYLFDWEFSIVRAVKRDSDAAQLPPQRTHGDGGAVMGAFNYLAPEQARAEADKIDERTDVFGLGALLYQMITNRPPWVGSTTEELLAQAAKGDWAPVESFASVPASLSEVVRRAMAPEQDQRFATVLEFKAALVRSQRQGNTIPGEQYKAGTNLVNEGDDARSAFILKSGQCQITRNGVEVREIGPGDVFGELALLLQRPRTASVIAKTDVTVLRVDPDRMDQAVGKDGWVRALLTGLSQRFVELEKRVARTDN